MQAQLQNSLLKERLGKRVDRPWITFSVLESLLAPPCCIYDGVGVQQSSTTSFAHLFSRSPFNLWATCLAEASGVFCI